MERNERGNPNDEGPKEGRSPNSEQERTFPSFGDSNFRLHSFLRISDFEHPPVFRADHPFIFVILDFRTGSLLFLGRLANPAG